LQPYRRKLLGLGIAAALPCVAALAQRLPSVFGGASYAQAGGLMSYGVDFSDAMRRAAVFVERILNGARPADLPVEQSSKFELVVNMKTAKALGVAIPQSVLLRADEVIE
jgi:putative ABC transport system substrate-binding protein